MPASIAVSRSRCIKYWSSPGLPVSVLRRLQVAQMKELYAERMASKDCFDFIAEELGGSLTARQARHLGRWLAG